MGDSFTHLHLHTEFSMLDGAARVKEVVAAAVADGQPAIGITDHGNMYGVLDFYRECHDQGVNPVIGLEAYMAGDSRHERPTRRGRVDDTGGDGEEGQKLYYHLTLLAESTLGYKNLLKLSSDAFLEGYYMKPRCDWDMLEQYHEGVVATTGCLGGVVLQALLRGDVEEATRLAARLQDIFGRDNLFVELQDHGLAKQHKTNPQLLEIARRIQAPLLATNDSHYTHREDAVAHDALLCVQTGASLADEKRFKFEGDQHYLKSAFEMRSLFQELPEACDNTLWIAERAKVEIEFGKPKLPEFPLAPGFASASQYLRHLTYEGAYERYGRQLPPVVVERIDYELGVIDDMHFADYFLVVWDLIRFARERKIRVGPGRGSAAGCCVAYCLHIVDLDPIKYDLLFERFLNPGRKQMPDIDMDFDDRYRGDMIKYAAERYGWDHVAQIVTFSTIKARAAVRDAARVLGYPYAVGDRVAKAMPPLVMGRDTPLYACLELTPKFEDGYRAATELRNMYDADPDVKKVVDVARGLEGLRRQDGIHAAAVVITHDPLTEYLPIQRKPESGKPIEEAPIVTQYEMHGVEELGLLKMDFLGLRNLSVIEQALDLIELSTGTRPDIDNVPLDDEKTLEMLRRGDSIGVFQLEGGPMRALMRSLAPTSFDDVAALVALYRPGPMAANMHNDYADRKNGRKPIEYLHPDAEEILGATYGLCLTGETVVHDCLTGLPRRLDQIDPDEGFWIQGVDDDYGPAVRQVTHWVCNGEKETFRLELRNGMEVTGTANHPILTDKGWKQLGDLGPTDYVAVPKALVEPLLPQDIDEDRLRILGYLIADGSLSVKTAICFVNSDADVLAAFRESVARAFPSTRLSELVAACDVHRVTVGNGKGHGGGASPLLQWLREIGLKAEIGALGRGGLTSSEKFVPDVIFAMSNDAVATFVAALWDCDGHVNQRMAHYRTISKRLAAHVQRLLLRLGIVSTVTSAGYVNPGGNTETAYQVSVFDGRAWERWIRPRLAHPQKRATVLAGATKGTTLDRSAVIASARPRWEGNRASMGAAFGMSPLALSPWMARKHPQVHESTLGTLLRGLELDELETKTNVQWVQVRGVAAAGVATVYDITVDDVHNFIANGIACHNCLFQEQMMRLAQKFAGYSLEESDNLRKAAGKKDRAIMAKEREKFVAGAERAGYGAAVGTKWFDLIEPFADYAFNRSHSYGYGLVSYQTAWLKANHPVEYFAALLTSVKDDKDKTAVYLSECRSRRIEVLVPDVNLSASDFIARGTKIPFGLSAIRNVGEGLVDKIVEEREANGPFTTFYDFCERVDPMVLNKRSIESLIKAGAFDSLGHARKGLSLVFEQIVDRMLARRKERDQGVMSLFGDGAEDGSIDFDDARIPIPDIEFDKMLRLAFEKEMLGLYISDHPLLGAESSLRRHTEATIAELRELKDGDVRWVGGVVTALGRRYTKKGDLMATFQLEDLQSSVECWVFPRVMQEYGHTLADDAIVCVKARLDTRDDQPKLTAMEIKRPEVVHDNGKPVRVSLPLNSLTDTTVEDLKRLLLEHPGESPVFLHVGDKVLKLADQFNVDSSNGLLGELRVLLGPNGLIS